MGDLIAAELGLPLHQLRSIGSDQAHQNHRQGDRDENPVSYTLFEDQRGGHGVRDEAGLGCDRKRLPGKKKHNNIRISNIYIHMPHNE